MRRIADALCFALAFAIPACVAAVAYPFAQGPAASPDVDSRSAFQFFCLCAFLAGVAGGMIYSVTLAYRNPGSSVARAVFSGIATLAICALSVFLVALLFGTGSNWLGVSVLIASLLGSSFVCAVVLGKTARGQP